MSAIDDLSDELARLPGIGRKTALRLAFHLLKAPADDAKRLARAIVTMRERVRPCDVCGNLTEASPCPICANPRRDAAMVTPSAYSRSPPTGRPRALRVTRTPTGPRRRPR